MVYKFSNGTWKQAQSYRPLGSLSLSLFNIDSRSTYKLHVGIKYTEYDKYRTKIENILDKGIEDGVIWMYKSHDYSVQQMIDSMERSQHRVSEASYFSQEKVVLASKYRAFNNPIVIYIPDKGNIEKIAKMCQEIEQLLTNVPIQEDSISLGEIHISPHFCYRRETVFGMYINQYTTPSIILAIVSLLAYFSNNYSYLTTILNEKNPDNSQTQGVTASP